MAPGVARWACRQCTQHATTLGCVLGLCNRRRGLRASAEHGAAGRRATVTSPPFQPAHEPPPHLQVSASAVLASFEGKQERAVLIDKACDGREAGPLARGHVCGRATTAGKAAIPHLHSSFHAIRSQRQQRRRGGSAHGSPTGPARPRPSRGHARPRTVHAAAARAAVEPEHQRVVTGAALRLHKVVVKVPPALCRRRGQAQAAPSGCMARPAAGHQGRPRQRLREHLDQPGNASMPPQQRHIHAHATPWCGLEEGHSGQSVDQVPVHPPRSTVM